MLFKPKHIKPDKKWDTTLNRRRGGDCRLLKFKGFVASVPRLLKLIVVHQCLLELILGLYIYCTIIILKRIILRLVLGYPTPCFVYKIYNMMFVCTCSRFSFLCLYIQNLASHLRLLSMPSKFSDDG
jgi:hypothetical protein